MLLILLLAVAAILIYLYVVNLQNYWKNKNVKHLKPMFFLGNISETIFARKAFPELLQETYSKFEDERYYGMYQLFNPVLVAKDPELIKRITIKDFDSFSDHQAHTRPDVDPLWGNNLATMRGERWHNMRSTLSPAFTSSKMRTMFFLIDECANDLVKHILDKNEDIVTLELKDTFSRTSNDCIASCAFGLKCNSLDNPYNEFYLNAKYTFDFSGFKLLLFLLYNTYPGILKILGIKVINEKMSNYFQSVIKETIKSREDNSIIRPDMLHLMLEARKGRLNANDKSENIGDSFASVLEYNLPSKENKKQIELTDLDITAQAFFFFFAGYDTTSFALSFTCYELAVNADIQNRLIQEIDDTYNECKGKITYDALMKMKYLDMVVSETLRKWPASTLTDRMCAKEFIIEPEREGETRCVITKGSTIVLPIYAIHRDPDYYPNPETFDPERFSNENKSKINNFMYIPFGSGPRNCIGSRFALMEVKAVLFHVLTKFQIVPVQKSVIPIVLSKKNFNPSSEGGFWFGFKKRDITVT